MTDNVEPYSTRHSIYSTVLLVSLSDENRTEMSYILMGTDNMY